jgi:hypothetical protein
LDQEYYRPCYFVDVILTVKGIERTFPFGHDREGAIDRYNELREQYEYTPNTEVHLAV